MAYVTADPPVSEMLPRKLASRFLYGDNLPRSVSRYRWHLKTEEIQK
jgi:hypothetical protein